MADTRTITMGLTKIEMGAVDTTTGEPQSTLTQIGYTYKDSCSMSAENPEITELFVEEVDLPMDTQGELGKLTLSWDILNPNVSEFAAMMGGTADTSNDKWSAPTSWSAIEKAFCLTPKKGFKLEIPRANVTAQITGGWRKGEPMLLHMEITVLVPTTSGGVAKPPYVLTKLS